MKRMCMTMALGVLLALGGCAVTDTGNPPLSPPSPGDTIVMSQLGGTVSVLGMAGAVDASTGLVRVTNLDNSAAPVDAPIQADGSFTADLSAEVGDVLRLQRVDGQLRSAPIDIEASSGELAPTRIPCLTLSTDYLDADLLEATTEFEVVVNNDCETELRLETRLRGADSPLPIVASIASADLTAGASTTLLLSIGPPSDGEGEGVVLLVVDGGAARRAVTVRGVR